MGRWIAVACFLIFLSSAGSAGAFGSFTPVSERSVADLDGSYRIGLLNTGNRTRQIELSAVADQNISVAFDRETLLLEPSRVSEEPRGEGWLYTGEVYVEPVYIGFNATIDGSTVQRDHAFHVDVTASVPGTGDGTGPSVVQQRRHTFSLHSSSPVLASQEQGSDGLFDIIDGGEGQRTGSDDRDDESGETGSGPRAQQKNITSATEAPTGDGGIDAVTVALVAAITVTVASILRELL